MGEKVKCLACNGSGEIEIPPTTKLRHLRIARGLSLRKAARGLCVSPTTLGKWEKEKEPNISLKYMRKLAAFYDTKFSTLFCDDVSDPETEANARLIAAAVRSRQEDAS